MRRLVVALLWAGALCGCGAGPERVRPCEADAGTNPASCPADWAGARALCSRAAACTTAEPGCRYGGAGDYLSATACYATAVALCFSTDGGTAGEWRCAQ